MAAKKQKREAEDLYVVISVRRRGLDHVSTFFGPFTKARAHVFASHHQQYEGTECCVEELETPCEHNDWIFEGVT
jgi:hypothetical protein